MWLVVFSYTPRKFPHLVTQGLTVPCKVNGKGFFSHYYQHATVYSLRTCKLKFKGCGPAAASPVPPVVASESMVRDWEGSPSFAVQSLEVNGCSTSKVQESFLAQLMFAVISDAKVRGKRVISQPPSHFPGIWIYRHHTLSDLRKDDIWQGWYSLLKEKRPRSRRKPGVNQ